MKKRILSVLTALALVLTWLPSAAIAAESGAAPDSMGIERGYREEHVSVPDAEDLPSNDELFAGYVEQVLYEDILDDIGMFAFKDSAGKRLQGNNKIAYEYLKEKIIELAAKGGNSVIEMPLTLFSEKTSWTASDLKLDTVFEVSENTAKPTQAAVNALAAIFSYDPQKVVGALMVDCPYEMYWFNKTSQYSAGMKKGYVQLVGESPNYSIAWTEEECLQLTLKVAQAYQDGNETTVKNVGSVATAVKENALAIVNKTYNSDYERLYGYMTEICNLVEYNQDAADNDNTPYGDPWQLIHVFDHTTGTKQVVCEGYAKAFQYLCDLTNAQTTGGFSGDVECYIVSGPMTGGTGAGGHMWNIVRIDGKGSYLVDVTNCDGNSVGAPDKLFMVGGTDGTWNSGYKYFTGTANQISYQYYDGTQQGTTNQVEIWSQEILTLAAEDYPIPTDKVTPVLVAPVTPLKATYGQTLSNVPLDSVKAQVSASDSTEVAGKWSWVDSSTLVGDATTAARKFRARFTPDDTTIYNSFTAEISVTVDPKTIEITVTGLKSSYEYDGTPIVPDLTVTGDGKTLVADTDYTLYNLQNNVNVGQVNFSVLSVDGGNYTFSKNLGFTIVPASRTLTITVPSNLVYDGDPVTAGISGADITYSYENGGTATVVWYSGSQRLDTAPTDAGTYQIGVSVAESGNYAAIAETKKEFTIAKATPVLSNIEPTTPVYTSTTSVTLTGTATYNDGTVEGSWAFKGTPPTSFTMGEHTYDVTFTPTSSNYNAVDGKVTFTVLDREVSRIEISGAPNKPQYNHGETFDPAGVTVNAYYADAPDTAVDVTESAIFNDGKALTAGQTTVKVAFGGKETTISGITVNKLKLEVDTAYVNTFQFDGTEKKVKLTNTPPTGVMVAYTGDTSKIDVGNYTASAAFSLAEGYDASCYEIVNKADAAVLTSPLTMTWNITQAQGGTYSAEKVVRNTDKAAQTIDLSDYIPANCGTISAPAAVTVGGTNADIIAADPSVDADTKTLTFALADGDIAAGQSATLTVTIQTLNYSDITVTVTVITTDKAIPVLTVEDLIKTYDGAAVTLDDIQKSAVGEEGAAIEGTWSFVADAAPSIRNVADSGTYELKFVPQDTETYAEVQDSVVITINQTNAAVTGKTLTITEGDAIPDPLYDIEGLVAGETLSPAPVASCEATASSPAGSYPITFVDEVPVSTDGNYSITYTPGVLTIKKADPPVVDPDPEPPVIHVTGVSLDQSVLHLTVGGTAQLVASVAPSNAGNRNVTWSSSEPAVAAVSGGAVTALRPGSAVITVTTVDGGYAASCAVTVTAPVTPPVNPGNPGGGYPTTPVTPVVPNTPSNPGASNNNNNNNSGTNTPGDSAPSTPSNSSVAPEATVSGGTASAVVSGDMASQLVDQAASGVSTVVIAPEISGSVNRTEVSIPASAVSGIAGGSSAALKVETPAANITISNSGLASLGGQDVTIAAEKTGGTVSVEITAGGQTVSSVTGGLKVEIPADCGPGTVAQLVDENGNVLSTLRKSYASGQTMNVPLEGSAKVIFVDNGKSFADVPAGNWAANAVAFASGHELMNGVSASSFSPAEPMTRGMLAVVLHNLEGNPGASYSGSFGDVGGNDWYAQAVQWAADNSIVTGVSDGVFAPNASITREQLVVMLYRYAGEPNAGGSLTGFSDSANVSSWAQQAMAWAVSSGIVGGSNGALNPQSGATRAEVAQMLMNFVTTGEI